MPFKIHVMLNNFMYVNLGKKEILLTFLNIFRFHGELKIKFSSLYGLFITLHMHIGLVIFLFC